MDNKNPITRDDSEMSGRHMGGAEPFILPFPENLGLEDFKTASNELGLPNLDRDDRQKFFELLNREDPHEFFDHDLAVVFCYWVRIMKSHGRWPAKDHTCRKELRLDASGQSADGKTDK